MADQTDKHSSLLNRLPTITAFLLSGLALWFCVALFLDGFKIQSTTDWLQAIASIFSSLAVIVAIYSLKLQQNNVDRQLFEARSAAFSSTFKTLYDIHISTLSTLEFDGRHGKECFSGLLSSFKKTQSYKLLYDKMQNEETKDDLRKQFRDSVILAYNDLFAYLNTISLMLHIIDEEKSITQQQKINYIDIIKAQLTTDELIFLLYHILLMNTENNNLSNIATEYSLFETIKAEAKNRVVQDNIKPKAFKLDVWDSDTSPQ